MFSGLWLTWGKQKDNYEQQRLSGKESAEQRTESRKRLGMRSCVNLKIQPARDYLIRIKYVTLLST